MSTNEVIDILVSQHEKAKPLSLPALLARHTQENIDMQDDNVLKTNRRVLWNKAMVFYKRGITTSPELLKKDLLVEFSGEEGADAGALKFEFFEKMLQEMNDHWFEGCDCRRIPRCHWGCESQMEMAGAMLGHSVLLGGPGFPCLHPAIFHVLASGDASLGALDPEDLPTIEDIPQDASTMDLIDMISKLNDANTHDEINRIIDDPRYMAIVNASGWPTTKCITPISKTEFLQKLIFSEVVLKRRSAIDAFSRGLERFNLVKLLKDNTQTMKPVFLFDATKVLTLDKVLHYICTPKPQGGRQQEVYEWFVEYIRQPGSRTATLEEILSFVSGLRRIPPMGLKECIKIEFLQTSPLPKAEACFCIIKLPTMHTERPPSLITLI